MKTGNRPLSDAELDGILDRLVAPAPSDALKRRVAALAPLPVATGSNRTVSLRRFAVAAVLTLTVGSALLLYRAGPPDIMSAEIQPAPSAPDPRGEIAAQDIALVDGPAPNPPAETLSIAGLPLE